MSDQPVRRADHSASGRSGGSRRRTTVLMLSVSALVVVLLSATSPAAAVTTTRVAAGDSQVNSGSPGATYGTVQKIAVCDACALSGAPTKGVTSNTDVFPTCPAP